MSPPPKHQTLATCLGGGGGAGKSLKSTSSVFLLTFQSRLPSKRGKKSPLANSEASVQCSSGAGRGGGGDWDFEHIY